MCGHCHKVHVSRKGRVSFCKIGQDVAGAAQASHLEEQNLHVKLGDMDLVTAMGVYQDTSVILSICKVGI